MKTIVLAALLAAAACSKKSSTDCDAAIARGTEGLLATVRAGPAMQDSLKELERMLRTELAQRCKQDRWSPEAVECFTGLARQSELQGCESKLSDDQRTKMREGLAQVMSSIRMPGAGHAHPPTLAGSGAAAGSQR